MNYDYSVLKQKCEDLGLVWHDDMFLEFDYRANMMKLTQEQVGFVISEHLSQIKMAFTPKLYSFGQRVKIALFFLTGYLKK